MATCLLIEVTSQTPAIISRSNRYSGSLEAITFIIRLSSLGGGKVFLADPPPSVW
jgi:hypothetical protein